MEMKDETVKGKEKEKFRVQRIFSIENKEKHKTVGIKEK